MKAFAVASRHWTIMVIGVVICACGKSGEVTGPSSSSPLLSHLELFPAERVAYTGEIVSLSVIARDSNGVDVSGNVRPVYSVSDSSVLTLHPDGNVTATGVGRATVRASAGGRTAETVLHVGLERPPFNPFDPPRVLDANYIDLSKIAQISRFRSAIGHSSTGGSGETCRSMKHYFLPKLTVDWQSVDIYAPAAGTIFHIRRELIGSQILLRPRNLPALVVTIFHVNLDPRIVPYVWVNAGDRIGRHASPSPGLGLSSTMSDIMMSIGSVEQNPPVSYFLMMTDAVFAEYQARGVPSRESAIITREERDADPVPCVGEQQFPVQGRLPNWLILN